MNFVTHIPGPWMVEDQREMTPDEPFWIIARHPKLGLLSIAVVRAGCDEVAELGDLRATATLMAAAPDLLEALQALLIRVTKGYDGLPQGHGVRIAEAAIAKLLCIEHAPEHA